MIGIIENYAAISHMIKKMITNSTTTLPFVDRCGVDGQFFVLRDEVGEVPLPDLSVAIKVERLFYDIRMKTAKVTRKQGWFSSCCGTERYWKWLPVLRGETIKCPSTQMVFNNFKGCCVVSENCAGRKVFYTWVSNGQRVWKVATVQEILQELRRVQLY